MVQVAVADVVVEERLYPRQKLDEQHAAGIAATLKAGYSIPPILLQEGTLILVDGRHRLFATQALGREHIEATLKMYASEADLYAEAIYANSTHGKGLTAYDRIKAAEQGQILGLTEQALASAMRTSIESLRSISKRYAFTNEDLPELRKKVPLKASTRHLINQRLSDSQVAALDSAPGMSYLLVVNQLLDGLRFQLVPPPESSVALWTKLRELRDLILRTDIPPAIDNPT